jgi:hypothetical protein
MMTRPRSLFDRPYKRACGSGTSALLATEEITAGDNPTSNTMTGTGERGLHNRHFLLDPLPPYRHRALINKTGEVAVDEEGEEGDTRRDMGVMRGSPLTFRPWDGGIIPPSGGGPASPFQGPWT